MKVVFFVQLPVVNYNSLQLDILKVLLATSATEAGAERVFSTEKLLHSELRNRMKPSLVAAMLKVRFNEIITKNQSLF